MKCFHFPFKGVKTSIKEYISKKKKKNLYVNPAFLMVAPFHGDPGGVQAWQLLSPDLS